MKDRQIITLSLLFFGCMMLLLFGGEILEQPVRLFFGFPVGNIISWFGLLSLSLLTKAGPKTSLTRSLSDILITAALSWLPLGYYVTGNVEFTFSGSSLGWELWISYSLLIGVSSLILSITGILKRTDHSLK